MVIFIKQLLELPFEDNLTQFMAMSYINRITTIILALKIVPRISKKLEFKETVNIK